MEELKECNCCGSSDFRRVYSQPDYLFKPDEWFDVCECQNCGIGFVNPRPGPTEMHEYYPSEFYDPFDVDNTIRYRRQAAFLPKGGRLLDIGCAKGHFPRFMRERGWEVEGTEPHSKVSYDFPVFNGRIDQLPVEDSRYDAVTAWAVMEHTHDPAAYFKTVARILKPGGKFVFLVTNFRSLSSRALFREDIPRHLFLFTEDSISRYVNDVGLVLTQVLHDKTIYSMRPVNITYYLISKLFFGRVPEWKDLPENRASWLARRGLHNTPLRAIQFFATRPVVLIDRVFSLVYEQWQIATKQYGIVIYTVTKPF